MKQTLIDFVKRGTFDELYTPEIAIKPLIKYVPNNKIIWECTDYGNSEITRVFRERGHKVITSHVNNKNENFFTYTPKDNFDIIITNPPYSLKDNFLERAYEIGKPFCFLLPITTLEGVRRGKLFREYGIQVLVLDRRVDFTGKGSNWFNVSWFCWKVLPRDLIFEEIEK